MFKDVLGIFSWTLACFCILLRFPELLKRYVSRTVTCIWPSAKNSSLPSLTKTKRVNFTTRLSTCQDIRLQNAPKNGMAQLHILKNLWFINCISSHESCQVFIRPLHVKLTTPSCNLIFCSTHAPFHTQKPSILLPAFLAFSQRRRQRLMMKNQNVEIKMPHLDVPGIFSKWLLVNGVEFHLILRFKRDFTTVISSDDSNLLLPSSNIQSHSKHQVEQFWNLRFELHSDFRYRKFQKNWPTDFGEIPRLLYHLVGSFNPFEKY